MPIIQPTTLDLMEYATDGEAQAAFVTNSGCSQVVDQENTTADSEFTFGDSDGSEYRHAQSFVLSGTLTIVAVEVKQGTPSGSPTGNWTLRIETNNAGVPSGTLADANASIVVVPPGAGNTIKGTFATSFQLNAATTYWLVAQCDNQSNDVGWGIAGNASSVYAAGVEATSTNGSWAAYTRDLWFRVYKAGTVFLQDYSEATIKQQGSYSLKGIAEITTSLNKTLTRTVSPVINLTDKTIIRFDMRASRTGANIKIGIHDSGGTTTEITPTIATADTWQTVVWDISAVTNANKDAIDSIIVTIVNADAANTFYIDNMFADVIPGYYPAFRGRVGVFV